MRGAGGQSQSPWRPLPPTSKGAPLTRPPCEVPRDGPEVTPGPGGRQAIRGGGGFGPIAAPYTTNHLHNKKKWAAASGRILCVGEGRGQSEVVVGEDGMPAARVWIIRQCHQCQRVWPHGKEEGV